MEMDMFDFTADSVSRMKEIEEHAKSNVTEMTKEEKLSSKYCCVGEHSTKETLSYCAHCKRTFCEEHGEESINICSDCVKL